MVPNQKELQGLDPIAQVVFMWLCYHANQDGECFPSQATLCKESGAGRTTVKKALTLLENIGLIEKEIRKDGNRNLTNLYQVIIGGVGREATPLGREATEGVGRQASRELNPSSLTQSNEEPSQSAGVLKGIEFSDPENLKKLDVDKKTPSGFRDAKRVAAGKPPMGKRKITDKQRQEIIKLDVLSYFQKKGLENGLEYLLEDDEQANKKFVGLAKSFKKRYTTSERMKAVIDWWFSDPGNAWCDYHPSNFFSISTWMKYDNKEKTRKGGVIYG